MAYDKIVLITDPLYVHSVLKNVSRHYHRIQVKVESLNRFFTSHLLNVDYDNRRLMLDEMSHEAGLHVLQPGQSLVISGKNNDVKFRFHTTVLTSDQQNHADYYHVGYPSEIEYAQRRESFRLELDESWQFNARITEPESVLNGTVQDISIGGICMSTHDKPCKSLKNQSVKLSLDIPGGEPIPCTAYICDIRNTIQNTNKVACKFLELDDEKFRAIQSYIFKVQRNQKQMSTA